ncbi:MAG: methyl-accepting chemotaxis protein [Porticoccaceae bacterium]
MNNRKGASLAGVSVVIMVALLVALAIVLGYVFYTLSQGSEFDNAGTQLATDMRTLSGQAGQAAAAAAHGDEAAFDELDDAATRMQNIWEGIKANPDNQLPANDVVAFGEQWQVSKGYISTVLSSRGDILKFRAAITEVENTLPRLQTDYSKVAERLLATKAPSSLVEAAHTQTLLIERIGRSGDRLLAGDNIKDNATQFAKYSALFDKVLNGMRHGDNALGIKKVADQQGQVVLGRVNSQLGKIKSSISTIQNDSSGVIAAAEAARNVEAGHAQLVERGEILAGAMDPLGRANRDIIPGVSLVQAAIVGVGLLIGGLALLAFVFYVGARKRLQETEESSRDNQEAILRLLDEIQGLGEGDLTAEATVTEDFTGAIADAFNFAIVQLRELVSRIVDTAEKVSSSSKVTRSTALQLSEAAEHQAQEIAGASAAVNEMAITIDQVSANAAESAAVAERSVSIAANGAEVVRNTIKGMDRIREQIQDTSKRIKRLGESSQEVGDIVSLIGDIADQTNILSLNAAIQASMAGDAGRGFAVVADEVQRLAERSANATKQITALVNTIQSDTKEAVASMETTTAEVVSGAALTQDAGVALGEIETVSANLAELIQDISTAARHQSTTAGHISNTMNVIQDITSRTLERANETATSIADVAETAIELRESVSGLKLPSGSGGTYNATMPTTAASLAASHQTTDNDSYQDRRPSDIDELFVDPSDDEHSMNNYAAPPSGSGISSMLAENSATLDEMDFSDDQPASSDTNTAPGGDFAQQLEGELADLNLDEFDLGSTADNRS